MIKLTSLIDLLSSYFKDNDTYKDSNDKGILERFLDICGNYFKDEIHSPIYNFLDNIDPDTANPLLLNYIWEFFGNIPYAYGVLYTGKDWDKYSNITLNRATWENEIITNSPRAYARDILKYAMSLYKIRGTLSFYDILLGFYGMGCSITDETGDLSDPVSKLPLINNQPYHYDDGILYDEGTTIVSPNHYDLNSQSNCTKCLSVSLTIYVNGSITIDDNLKARVLSLLNRFRPVHVGEFTTLNCNFVVSDCFNYLFNFKMTS